MSKGKLMRRTTGGLCVGGALVMLVMGETQLQPGGSHLGFALYWLGCFALAIAAMILALLDLLAVRSEARQAQRSLFEETLIQIREEKRHRPPPSEGESDLKD